MINPDITMKEKRQILENDRKVRDGSTFFAHARADAELNLGGRYAKVQPTSVTGANPGSVYPRMPEGNPWAKDECPPEPSLGYAIDEQEPVGEPHEIAASRPGDATNGDLPRMGTDATDAVDVGTGIKLRRRI